MGGWFDSIWGKRTDDPLRDLDPRLREFLEKESPVKLQPAAPDLPSTISDDDAAAAENAQPKVPPQSLFPDGRYAHLWKTYTPLVAIEAAVKSDHQNLMDVVEAFKERKAIIGRAALLNCAMQHSDWKNCVNHGELADRMNMCKHQLRRFERCYNTQAV